MKVIGFVVFVSGILFTLYSFFANTGEMSASLSWAPWIGILVALAGGAYYLKARKEE